MQSLQLKNPLGEKLVEQGHRQKIQVEATKSSHEDYIFDYFWKIKTIQTDRPANKFDMHTSSNN